MGKQVTVLPGFSTVSLPQANGPQPFSAGQTAVLTDAEYTSLTAATTRALSSPTNVAEPNRPGTDPRSIAVTPNTVATGTVTATPGYNAFKATGALTIQLSGFAAGQFSVIRVEVQQDATGSRTITLPTVKWPGGTAPTPTATANKTDLFEFFSRDGGTTVFGRVLGQNF